MLRQDHNEYGKDYVPNEEIEEYIRESFHEIEGVKIRNMKLVSEDI